jgi:hypothetical protein
MSKKRLPILQDYEYFSTPSRPAPVPARGAARGPTSPARGPTSPARGPTSPARGATSPARKGTELPATIMFGDSRQSSPASTAGRKSGASLASLYQVL